MKSLSLTKPHLLVMVGIPGSGKTFFAEKFSQTFHAPYVSLEKIASYIPENPNAAIDIMAYQLDELLKTHQPLIVEGFSDARTERKELARKAKAAGYETLFIWVQTDPSTTKSRSLRPTVHNTKVLGAEEYDYRLRRFTAPNSTEKTVVISGKHTYATQAKIVLKKLSAPRAEISSHTTPIVRKDRPGSRSITIR